VLDAGCGLGATADVIGKRTGAIVVGVDLDADAMAYANARYQDAQFIPGDITQLDDLALPKVAVIYAFNSLYACHDLEACFAAFTKIAAPDARIAVFDYVAYDAALLAQVDCLPPSVHSMAEMRQLPDAQGWRCTRIVNLYAEYGGWYGRFLARIDENREALAVKQSAEFFDEVRKKYADMRLCIERGVLAAALHTYARAT
jgi:SAM-dependent methyltransferase